MRLEKDLENLRPSPIPKKSKTWKREIALVMLSALLYFGYEGEVGVLEILATPFTFFVAWAFGLDWTGKNASSISAFVGRRSYGYDSDSMFDSGPIGFESRYRGGRQGYFSRGSDWEDEYEANRGSANNIRPGY